MEAQIFALRHVLNQKESIMGGGTYHSDVEAARSSMSTTRESTSAFDYSREVSRGVKQKQVHPDLDIKGRTRECCDSPEHPNSTPIAVVMDVTSSRGDDAKTIYARVPAFLGAIKVSDIVPDPQILWCAVGDANSDRAPLQVGQFESDRRIDEQLAKIWLEEGGGGTGEESYELAAYLLAHKTKLDATARGKKGFAFFTADEAPYPVVSPALVKSLIGDTLPAELPTADVFAALQRKFHTFVIFPRSTMEQRKTAIDSEIKQRLLLAGGRFQNVAIRASLLWNNRNDLDLHCRTPSGEHVFFGNKRGRCGGELDVDRNVYGEDPKPVENMRWAEGDARPGVYKFWVENFRYHESSAKPTPFRAELDIEGEIQTVEGVVQPGCSGEGSALPLFEFRYSPGAKKEVDHHANYRDEVILEKWSRYLPATNILRVEDSASCVEVMLGAMALQSGKLTLDQFTALMDETAVPQKRQEDVRKALELFAKQGVYKEVRGDLF